MPQWLSSRLGCGSCCTAECAEATAPARSWSRSYSGLVAGLRQAHRNPLAERNIHLIAQRTPHLTGLIARVECLNGGAIAECWNDQLSQEHLPVGTELVLNSVRELAAFHDCLGCLNRVGQPRT